MFAVQFLELVEDIVHHFVIAIQYLRFLLLTYMDPHFLQFFTKYFYPYTTIFQFSILVAAVLVSPTLT